MLNSEVVEKIELTSEYFILRIKPDAGVPKFIPGQYATVGLFESKENCDKAPKLIRRAYSVISKPSQEDYLEFYISYVEGGALTPKLKELKSGDRIFVVPRVIGNFTAHEIPANKEVVLVSTGTGLGPYISMLREGSIFKNCNKLTLLQGIRYSSGLAFNEELDALASRHEHFDFHVSVSKPDENWKGLTGHVGRHLENGNVKFEKGKTLFFLCGNPAMIDELTDFLHKRGFKEHTRKVPDGDLYLERYW